jgi:hypothetical protein
MFRKNLLLATGFVATLFLLYKICVFVGIPLYPYGMLLFLLPLFGLIPIFQYLSFKELSGYKKQLIESGEFTHEQLDEMPSHEVERNWREKLHRS